jgi:hypothetical protein
MHLAQGLSSLKTAKPKVGKLTKTQLKKYREELRDYNKSMKQSHQHDQCMDIEQYIAWVHGQTARKKPAQYRSSTEVKTFEWKAPANFRETPKYKSHDSGIGVAARKESEVYTGTLIKGISQMHKSNAVPVISQEEIVDIGHMRR